MSAAGYKLRGIYGTEPYWPDKRLKICVTGAGGFIASHLAKRLKEEGHYVVGCDWKRNEHMQVSIAQHLAIICLCFAPEPPELALRSLLYIEMALGHLPRFSMLFRTLMPYFVTCILF